MTMRWDEKRYYSLDYYLKQTYGEKLYKIALDGFNLFGNGGAPITGKITGSSGAAENAAAHTKSAVSVRTD